MARPRLLLRPSLLIILLLSMIIWSINSAEEVGDENPFPLTLGRLSIPGEQASGEGPIDQDDIIEYHPPPHPQTIYHPIIPFKRYLKQVQPTTSNADTDSLNMNRRRKKDCGFPVLTRRLFGPVMKRSVHYFANSEAEVQEKIKEEDKTLADPDTHARSTRSTESHSGGCIAKRQWIDMGSDYYPRYVKSYHCTSSTCDKGFGHIGECKGKHYTTKVLKRITTADSTSVEDCDQTLPEDLRVAWKLISVTVTTCCDCISPSRLFGLK